MKRNFCLLGLFVLLTFLFGCGAALHTTLDIDDAFGGSRIMVMEISPDDLSKIEGGAVAVERVMKESCPAAILAASPAKNEKGNSEYTFTIAFTDQKDYIGKVESILKREPVVQFSRPDSILATGFRVSEDFTSEDLMAWLKDAIAKDGLASGATLNSLWSMDKTTLIYGGQTYETGHKINVDKITAHPVTKITVDTVVEDEIARTVRFEFPASTVNALGDALAAHFAPRVLHATAEWADISGGKALTVTFTGKTIEELQAMSTALFSAVNQKMTYGRDESGTTPLCDRRMFVESMDLSGFSSGGTGGVRVEYRYENRKTDELVGGYQYVDGAWKEVGNKTGNVFVYSGVTELLNLQIVTGRQYYMQSGEIHTRRVDDTNFERIITFVYDAESQGGAAKYASEFFGETLGVNTETTDDGKRAQFSVTLTGTDSQLSEMMTKVFGTGTFLTYSRSKGALNFKHSASFSDHIDLSAMLVGDNKNAKIIYTLDMGKFEKIIAFHCLEKDEQGKTAAQRDFFPDEDGIVRFELPGARVEMDAKGEAPNYVGIALIGGILLCILLILIFVIVLIVRSDHSGKGPDDGEMKHLEETERKRLEQKEAEEKALAVL